MKIAMGVQAILALIAAGLGGWAFGVWQHSEAAGWFMFFVLDAVGDIPLALKHIAYKPNE